jgi:Uma2 family endonuclease
MLRGAGYRYELSRGVITVMGVPSIPHVLQVEALRNQVIAHQFTDSSQIKHVLSGGEMKLLLERLESERHPDLAIYRDRENIGDWAAWIPDIVVEVVSPSSRQRDYEEKPEEYLLFGVREYWIIDRAENQMLVHRRSGGRWQLIPVKSPQRYETSLVSGLKIDVQAVFDAAGEYQ